MPCLVIFSVRWFVHDLLCFYIKREPLLISTTGASACTTTGGGGGGGTAVNTISYNGKYYAALDGWSPTDSDTQGCQSQYLPLPSGWSIAPDNADSLSVISRYPWGTDLMVLSNGAQYYTYNSRYSGQAGQSRPWYCCSDGPTPLGQQTSYNGEVLYAVTSCARRILIYQTTIGCGAGTYTAIGALII